MSTLFRLPLQKLEGKNRDGADIHSKWCRPKILIYSEKNEDEASLTHTTPLKILKFLKYILIHTFVQIFKKTW